MSDPVGEARGPQSCRPEAFFNLTDLDREVLSQTDEEFVPHDWKNLKSIVGRCCKLSALSLALDLLLTLWS